jgi:hypothetical protein
MKIKTRVALGGFVLGFLGLSVVACGEDGGKVTGSGGGVGTGGALAGGGPSTGGDASGGMSALQNPIFEGQGTWVEAAGEGGAPGEGTIGEGNSVGIQGAFYILEDSVKGGVLLDDGLMHTDLDAVSGDQKDVEPSAFDETTVRPCIQGSTAQVAPAPDLGDPEGFSTFWGGGIGLNLSESGGDNSVKEAWDATKAGVLGFEFIVSGDIGTLDVRLKATVQDDPLTADVDEEATENYCVSIKEWLGKGVGKVALADITQDCWNPGGNPVDASRLMALQWQIVTSTTTPQAITNFCVEAVGTY